MQQQWATVSLTVFFTPPLNNCMGKVVIYFSAVKLLPVSEKYAVGAHKRLSNVLLMGIKSKSKKKHSSPRPHNYTLASILFNLSVQRMG